MDRLVTGNGLVHRLAVVRTIRYHGRDLVLDCLKQRWRLTGIIVGQQAGDDLAAAGVHGKVQLAPGATRPAVLLLIPFALAEQLQAGAVNHQMQRAVRDDLRLPSGKAAAAPAQGRVVRDAQRLPEQPHYARGEAFSLAQGEVEDEPQHQHELYRRVRVPGLAAGRAPPRCLPPCQGIFIKPERQVPRRFSPASYSDQFRTR